MKKMLLMCAVVAAMLSAWAEYTDDCITFSSAASFTLKANSGKTWDGTLWTSTDKNKWTEWSGAEVSAAKTGGTYDLYVRGDVNNTKITGFSQGYRLVLNGSNIACTGNIETLRGATGNNPSPTKMANYCYYGMFDSCKALTTAPALPATTLADYCYSVMFAGCTSLTDAPALPATTLANGCYNVMFWRCTALTNAPALPATTLADFCYDAMFANCDSLTEAPALPATTLALACYSHMFFGCTALTNAPALPATTLVGGCYSHMFDYCTALTAAPSLPATTLASQCYQGMFDRCTALKEAPALPATTLADECYRNMFEGCTALTSAPELPATTLTDSCYSNMFYGCTALEVNTAAPGKEWKIPATSTTATNWGVDMFKGTGGTLRGQPALNTTYYIKSALPPPIDDCITFSSAEAFTLKTYNTAKNWDGMLWTSTDKNNWTEWNGTEVSAAKTGGAYNLYVRGNENNTVITGFHPDYEYHQYRWVLTGSAGIACTGNIETLRGAEGEDPSPKEMAFYCYYSMFYGCTALTSAPTLPATTLMGGCYSDMFYGCTSLTNAPALPATELWDQCYYDMFRGCTSLTNAPALPATMAAQYCYSYMFYGCTSLTNAPALPATTLDWYCYEYMFYGCTSLTDAPALPAKTLAKDCYNSMFYGCTSLTTAPALPATTLAMGCYYRMFEDCASLEVNAEAPGKEWKIPATSTTAQNWGTGMFSGTKGTLQGQPALNTTYYIKSAPPEPTITDVKAQQRYPWNGKVDISYTVENAGTETRELYVRAVDQLAGITNVARSVTGDTAYTSGKHHIVWDMAADGLTLVSTSVVFSVSYVEPSTYCVIDLSGGASATCYPVTYLDNVPSGGWSDDYKTTKLVLRKIDAGIFTMGGRSTDYPGASDEGLHQVTLTKVYWMGVFQVTQRQWELVMGTRPSYFNNDTYYAPRPVERISYNMIRGSSAGAGWPNSSAVDATSFLGVIRAKSGLQLDLPTEAQWEYACRAGTTTALNSGKNLTSEYLDSEMTKVGRYWYDGGSGYSQSCDWSVGTAKVGSYAQNAWGLHDMHGNVWEWCRDWYGLYSGDATDPKGSSSGSYRVVRGGGWHREARDCRSANRSNYPPSGGGYSHGFRLVRTLSDNLVAEIAARSEAVAATSDGAGVEGFSDPVRIDLTPGTRTAAKTEVLTYSTEWEGDIADAVAVVSVNGDVISEQSGSGTVEWTPSRGGANVLTHVVMQDGVPVGETLTATFNVNGGPYKEIIDGVEWTYMAYEGKATLGGGSPEDPAAVPTSTAGALVVPLTIGGCTVDSIAEHAFQGCDKLTAITISEGVVRIGAAAFEGCDSLNAVDFECAPPEGIGNASIKQDAAIRYNVRYETQWLSVIAQCGWTNAAPYDPHHRYTTSRVISVNICGGAAADKATDAAGLVPVPVSAWNNYQTVNRDYSGITWNGSRTVTLEDNWTVRPSGKTVWYWVPSGVESILRYYVDDNDSIYSTMIFSDIPFARYDVCVYMAADTNAKFNPVSLTADGVSTTYTCGERGIGVAGETKWGQSQERASRAGQNTIVIRGQNARNLTISGGPRGATRGAIAAVQIVEAVEPTVYLATMSEDTEWHSLKWEPAVPEGGFEKGAKLDLTVIGSPTLSFDDVVAPNCELTIHGTPCIKMSDGLYEDGCWQRNFATFDVLVTTDAVSFAPVKDGFSGAYAQSICGFSLRAQNKEVISINFAHGIDRAVGGTNYTGLAPVQGNTWANMTETWSRDGKTVKLPPLRVTIDGATINYRPEISGSCYAANTYCWDTARDVFLKGYLDDGLNQAQVTVTNIPYSKYDVIVYCVTDSDNLAFRAVTVNGTVYTYDSEDPCVAKVGSDNWGVSRGVVAEYGRNAIRVCGQTSSTLTIKGGTNGDGARGGIAAIQIVCTGNADPLYWDYTVGVNDCGRVKIPDGVDPNRIRLYDPLGYPVEITGRDENFVYYEWIVKGVVCWWDYEFNQRGGESPVNTGRDNVSLVLDGLRDPLVKNKEYVTNDVTGEISIRAAAYPYRSVNKWTDVLTVVTYGTSVHSTNAYVMCVGSKTSGCLFLATGNDSARTLELCYSDRGNTPRVLGSFDVPASVDERHLYILSINADLDGNTVVTINVDGRTLYKYVHSGALAIGGGFQIAGIHGGIYNGRYRPTADDPAILDWVRVYDVELTDEAIRKYVEQCPSAPVPPQISPESGTTFGTSLTVSISCESEDAPVHYTLDGSDPTMESPVYSKKFRISSRTVVKAIAFREDGTASDMAVAEYAPGRCDDPAISPPDGTVFEHSGQGVSIRRTAEDGVLRYTIDGSDPTEASPEYAGPFTIDETTVVKAKAFGDQYFDSNIVTATLTRVWLKLATPVITADETFTGTKNKVVMSCANEGATIYYTLDGSEPTRSSPVYSKPFCVTEGCTIRAKAVQYDYTDSDVAEKEITREWGIGQTMGKPDHSFETSGDAGFVRVVDETAALGESMQSGEIKNSQTSILSTVVVGPGKLSFKWKTSCEYDPPLHEWDHAEFVLDGDILEVLDGETDWQSVSCDITGDGPHTVIWRYVKDNSEFEGEDCLWVSEYVWESEYTETKTTGVPVPYLWLEEKCSDVVDEFESYEKVAKQKALNKRLTVEQCYVAGVDPESLTQDFTTTITMEGGFPTVTWDPDLGVLREYKVWGRESLMSGDWVCPTNSTHRFFKVTVEMP